MSYLRPASKNNLTFSFSERSVTSIYIELVQACMHPNIIVRVGVHVAGYCENKNDLRQFIAEDIQASWSYKKFLIYDFNFFCFVKKLICASLLWQSTKILMVLGLAECLQPASFFFFFFFCQESIWLVERYKMHENF